MITAHRPVIHLTKLSFSVFFSHITEFGSKKGKITDNFTSCFFLSIQLFLAERGTVEINIYQGRNLVAKDVNGMYVSRDTL